MAKTMAKADDDSPVDTAFERLVALIESADENVALQASVAVLNYVHMLSEDDDEEDED